MISDSQFQRAAALVKNAVPADEWENFIGAFEAYTYTRIGELTDIGLDRLVVVQGQAQQCKKLLRLLTECSSALTGDTSHERKR